MWLVSFVVTATKHCAVGPHPEWGHARGAYVNALISFPEPNGAKLLAKMYATEDGSKQWRFRHFQSCRKVTLSNFKNDPGYQDYFAEAKRDGYSLVFHIYGGGNKAKASTDAAAFTPRA
jgi:hypothetical protein